jgi:hypothetical protein
LVFVPDHDTVILPTLRSVHECDVSRQNVAEIDMRTCIVAVLWAFVSLDAAYSQSTNATAERRIAVDVAHHQAFWGDPSNTVGMPASPPDRMRFLASKLQATALLLNAEVVFLNREIGASTLSNVDLLFIHVPTSRYRESEVAAVRAFLSRGGSLFLVMEVNDWASLEQVNVNDLIRPFGIQFGADSPDALVGGRTREGLITEQALKIPYHGGRIVTGGTPFSFSVGPEPVVFGTFAKLDGGGRLVVMGDGMASLYMNSWQGVDDYQTEAFMHDVVEWLLH